MSDEELARRLARDHPAEYIPMPGIGHRLGRGRGSGLYRQPFEPSGRRLGHGSSYPDDSMDIDTINALIASTNPRPPPTRTLVDFDVEMAEALALSAREAEEEKRKIRIPLEKKLEMMEKYKYRKYWLTIYGVDKELTLGGQAHREALIRRAGGPLKYHEMISNERKAKIVYRSPEELAINKIKKCIRQYLAPCENTLKPLPPGQLLRLGIKIINETGKEEIHRVAYDVIELYTFVRTAYRIEALWADPLYSAPLTPEQKTVIKKMFRKRSMSGDGEFNTFEVSIHDGEDFLVPLNLYDRIVRLDNTGYLMFRVTNPRNNIYSYSHVNGSHQLKNNVIYISKKLYKELGFNQQTRNQRITLEDCFKLPKVQHLVLKPLTPAWYSLPVEASDFVKQFLTSYLENLYVIKIGDVIPLSYAGIEYRLAVADIFNKTPKKLRIPAGITKDTSVDLEIVPQ